MNPVREFEDQIVTSVAALGTDMELRQLTWKWLLHASKHRYSYNFKWLGRPIIQFPQDIVAMQEIIWRCRPDLVIETGVAHGGSLILSASTLAMIEYDDALKNGTTLDPRHPKRRVVGIDIEIRTHNRMAIEAHAMASRIDLIEGSSVSCEIISRVTEIAAGYDSIMVILDSNHTHEHVLAELEAYAPLTTIGSYCIVFDTAIEDAPDGYFPDRPWGPGNNPKTAVWEYLRILSGGGRQAADGSALGFEVDTSVENKLLITVAPDGYLRRVA